MLIERSVVLGMTEQAALLAEIQRDWAAAGISGSLAARHLGHGRECGFETMTSWPLASVIKLPIALVVYDAFDRGDLDPAETFEIEPQHATRGPTGISLFRQLSQIAAEDLIQLSLAVSDNAATDILLDRIGIAEITRRLAQLGCPKIIVRHSMRALYGVAGAVRRIGTGLIAGGQAPGGGHLVGELDPHRANAGTAQALLELLDRVWADTISTPSVCARLRAALTHQLTLHRMAAELAADGVRVSSKTGTFLDLRHEAGVVEIGSDRIAVVALTRTQVDAAIQLEADFAIGHAVRMVVDALRR